MVVFRSGSRTGGGSLNAIAVVGDEVRELVRRRGLDPAAEPAAVRRLVDEVIADYDERAVSGSLAPLADIGSTARAVFDAVAGFGPLQQYLDDPTVEEIWMSEPVCWSRRSRRRRAPAEVAPVG